MLPLRRLEAPIYTWLLSHMAEIRGCFPSSPSDERTLAHAIHVQGKRIASPQLGPEAIVIARFATPLHIVFFVGALEDGLRKVRCVAAGRQGRIGIGLHASVGRAAKRNGSPLFLCHRGRSLIRGKTGCVDTPHTSVRLVEQDRVK